MTKSKISVIIKTNEWKGKNKWFFTCDMDNGDKISVMRDTNTALKVGDEIEYTLGVADEYGVHRITEPNTNKKKEFSKNYEKDAVTMSMSYAKDIIVANMQLPEPKPYIVLEATADRIYNWCLSKFDNKPVVKVEPVVEKKVEVKKIETEDDGLPF